MSRAAATRAPAEAPKKFSKGLRINYVYVTVYVLEMNSCILIFETKINLKLEK